MNTPGTGIAAGRLGVVLLVAVALLCMGQTYEQDEPRGTWERIRDRIEGNKPLPPADELFQQAEERFYGKVTAYGKMIRKVFGEESWAFKNLPLVKRKNEQKAKDLYQRLVDNYPFSKYAPIAELRIADCHYKLEEYEQAAILYRQFTKMHPRRDEVPYAIYQEGMCYYERMRKPSRDQDHTRDAVRALSEMLSRFPDHEKSEDAREKLAEARTRLARHELLVADFYFKTEEYWSAAPRYQGVHEGYPGLGFDERAMYREASCYDRLGKNITARDAYGELLDRFPEGEYANEARQRIESLEAEED